MLFTLTQVSNSSLAPNEQPKDLVVKQQDDDIVSLGSDLYASEEIEADLITVEDENFVVVKSLYVASFPSFNYLPFY